MPATVGLLRDLTQVHLAKWGASERFADNVRLVVSELVTNSVAACPGRAIVFVMYAVVGAVVVEVRDPSERAPVHRPAGPGDEGGRGLQIVGALAESWGTRWPPGGGKVVWAKMTATC
ncbi:ATP-binding protein [Thermomonospora echinospora]|uniref:ATP-binding protein n=1 Tax=Thermomonospora echinospora TaxID=1992 RepID=UPI0013589CFE|nr:ATP-binding protein [Thermomonospora echinospora]